MGRAPCCDKANVKRGPWSPEEDAELKDYIEKNGTGGNWIALPQKAGLRRCGKSCRLRWLNYLRPNIKHGEFSDDEDRIIWTLFANIGSRWSIIAAQLPGRTDNDIKNYWNTKLKKKLLLGNFYINPSSDHDPNSHRTPPRPDQQQHVHHHRHFGDPSLLPAIPTPDRFYELSPFNSTSSLPVTAGLQTQETFLGPINNVYSHEAATSCSSSDGSSGRDHHHQHPQFDHRHVPDNTLQGFSTSYYGNAMSMAGQEMVHYNNSQLDYYGIDEIKQLINGTSSSDIASKNINNNNNNNCNYSSLMFGVDGTSNVSNNVAKARGDGGGSLYFY